MPLKGGLSTIRSDEPRPHIPVIASEALVTASEALVIASPSTEGRSNLL